MIPGLLKDQDEWSTCLHEAAHAVTAIYLGVPCAGLLLPSGSKRPFAGLMIFGHGTLPTFAEAAESCEAFQSSPFTAIPIPNPRSHIVSMLAGHVAELLAGYHGEGGDWGDRLAAEVVAGQALQAKPYGARVSALLAHSEAEAEMIVDRFWDWLIRVARLLERKRKLTAAEIKSLRQQRTIT